MDITLIFVTQFLMSLLVWTLVARWFATPWLAQQTFQTAMMLLLVPHALRHVGLTFLVPGVVAEPMPVFFAYTAGLGDLASAVLAIVALLALRRQWSIAVAALWVVNVVGVADLANALRQAEAVPYFNAAWFIPTFYVPILLVTHGLMITRLLRTRSTSAAFA